MFKKKTALNVRPQPPSFAEMTEDINSADSNDIIFTQIKSETTDVSPSNGAESTQPDLSRTSSSSALSRSPTVTTDSDSDNTGVDLVYRQATEFISFTEHLKSELSDEQNQREKLTDACVQVTECLESMRRTVNDLRARTTTTTDCSS